MYERYVELRNQKGVSDYRVAKDTGFRSLLFSDWKSGRSKPKIAKLKILAGYFDVAVDELISATDETGSEKENDGVHQNSSPKDCGRMDQVISLEI